MIFVCNQQGYVWGFESSEKWLVEREIPVYPDWIFFFADLTTEGY